MDNVLSSEPFDVKHPMNYKMYTTYNFPGARNRDSVTHSTIEKNELENTVTLNFKSIRHPQKPTDLRFVRFPAIKGFWEFRTLSNGKTKITYQNIGLPGEYVQKILFSLYNYSTKESGAKTVVNLLKEARKPKYINTTLDYSVAKR